MAQPNLQSVAFPVLNDAQVAEFGRCADAVPKTYQDGETLVRAGEHDFRFYIVLSGEVEAIDPSGDEPKTITVHSRGRFTGDVSALAGSASFVTSIARGECQVLEITQEALRRALNRCPAISDIILQAFIARRQLLRDRANFTGLRVIGSRYSADTFRVRDFLARNRVLFTWIDVETDPHVHALLKEFGVTEADMPVVCCGHMLVKRNPSNRELADAVGIHRTLEQSVYDLAIVGAGPAGLAAAVYGASEGLSTVVLDRTAPGGQAGSSMRIENYLGFPRGITGAELTDRAMLQATKFGARLSVPVPGTRLEFENGYPILHTDGGETVTAKCLLIATGAEYRRLEAEGCAQYEGAGVYYAASPAEADICRGEDVVVVGGGNSAGQAAVFLSQHVRKVFLLIRGDDLYKNMSSYLVQRIEQTPSIELLCNTTVRRMEGNGHLSCIEITSSKTGEARTVPTSGVFSFIGAVPRTDWLPDEIERDPKGFVRTGPALSESTYWAPRRQPFLLETSHPGVFAAGDVRSGSAKRIAAAVGEGSMAIQLVHEYLKQM